MKMKKYNFRYIAFLLFFSSVVSAGELNIPLQSPIQSLIEQVKIAKVEDRRTLMNQLKIQLRTMNKESRHDAMVELKKSFSKKANKKTLDKYPTKFKGLHENKCTHQPKYRHLLHQRVEGTEGQRGVNGNGHK